MNKEIYEIFCACRLCGVGAGYKMPIIQSVIEFKNDDIPLKQKINECVQIEVNLQDTMPPLICEVCVDKIQDFYEFKKMCHKTNRNTRLRLGLPIQTSRNCASESIFSVPECLNSDSDDGKPLLKNNSQKAKPKSAKMKKEGAQTKSEACRDGSSRSSSVEVPERQSRERVPPAKRLTRLTRTEDTVFEQLQEESVSKSARYRAAPLSVKRKQDVHNISDNELEGPSSKPARYRPAPKSLRRNQDRQLSTDSMEDNNLLVAVKRSRPVAVEETRPVKKSKTTMEPPKTDRTPKPGPKSSQLPPPLTPPLKPPPKAGPKSKKLEPVTAKSQRVESKNCETLDCTARSRNAEPQSTQLSKSKSDLGKPPKGKKREDSSPAPKREGTPVQLDCEVCGMKAKAPQGLMSHLKVHTVNFTPPELACNACELWFPNPIAAGLHRKKHAAGLAFTCSKCYDDFRTAADYDMHFAREQCVSTYEVPDAQCEECWKTFPTYKLLEEHRCQGEGARPGGKCSSCRRVYATLKSLRTHEFRCTIKRKVEPRSADIAPPAPAAAAHEMLPVQVRIVRCDNLLTISPDGHCHVAGLSHKFGLDRKSTYPYLCSMEDIKAEPSTSFDPMVAIDDDIKQEYLKTTDAEDSFVHWDSDDSTNSDCDVSSPKTALSLSSISLRTIFSPKCLGKVPKKLRKVVPETYESVLSISFNTELKKNINNLIDSLGNGSIHSGDYDSDSILDKNMQKTSEDVFDILKENVTNDIEPSNVGEEMPDDNKTDVVIDKTDNADENIKNDIDLVEEKYNIRTNISQETTDNETNEHSQEVLENVARIENKYADLSKTITDSEKIENSEQSIKVSEQSQNNTMDCRSIVKTEHLVNNTILCENETVQVEEKVQNTTELGNADVENSEQDKSISNNDPEVNGSDTDSQLSEVNQPNDNTNDEVIAGCETDKRINDIDDSNESKNFENNRASNDTKENKTSCDATNLPYENDKTNDKPSTNDKLDEQSDMSWAKNYNDGTSQSANENYQEDDEKLHENNSNSNVRTHNFEEATNSVNNDATGAKSNITKEDDFNKENETSEPFAENLITECDLFGTKNTDNANESNTSNLNETKEEETNNESDISKNSAESLITENDLFGTKEVECVDKFNINNLDEEDKLLMAELDAQIGENLPENVMNNDNGSPKNDFGEKSDEKFDVIGENSNFNSNFSKTTNESLVEDKTETLDVLINKQDNLKSLDLDTISDEEFNFDI